MLAEMARLGVRVVVPGEAEFPSQLLDLPEPPLALWVRGPLDLRASALRSVAVVGARACTAYGERATAGLAGDLADDGWTIVSGGAFGIDAAAHRAALGVGGQTVAVMACGVDITYPRAHDLLLGRIADAGVGALGAAAGQPAPQASFPRTQPPDRRVEPGDGRRGGGAPQWGGRHRRTRTGDRPGRHGRSRAHHLHGQRRDQPAAPRAVGAGGQRQCRGRLAAGRGGGRRGRFAGRPRGAGPAPGRVAAREPGSGGAPGSIAPPGSNGEPNSDGAPGPGERWAATGCRAPRDLGWRRRPGI